MVSQPGFGPPGRPPAVQSEATDWIAALRGPSRGPAMEAEFRAWLARDLKHAQAFDATTQIWELLGAAGKAFRTEHRRKVFRQATITASAACVVVLVGVGVGAASHAVRRRKLSPA